MQEARHRRVVTQITWCEPLSPLAHPARLKQEPILRCDPATSVILDPYIRFQYDLILVRSGRAALVVRRCAGPDRAPASIRFFCPIAFACARGEDGERVHCDQFVLAENVTLSIRRPPGTGNRQGSCRWAPIDRQGASTQDASVVRSKGRAILSDVPRPWTSVFHGVGIRPSRLNA